MESVEGSQAEIGFVMVNNVQLKEFRHTTNYKNLEFHLLGKDTWYPVSYTHLTLPTIA